MIQRAKLLLVDDQPANLVALKRLLARFEVDIVCAHSGNEALSACLDHEFALILLDVNMPEMDGYEVASLLHEEESTAHIPIIFVTAAYKDEQHRLQGYSEGAVDYIEKPINDVILYSKVRVFLELYQRHAETKALAQRLSLATQAGGMGIWEWIEEKKIYLLDSTAQQLLSEPQAQTSDNLWVAHVHPEDLEGVQTEFAICCAKKTPFEMAFRLKTEDSKALRYLKTAAQPNENGMIGLCWDITQQHENENRLRLAANVFKYAQEGILVTNAAGLIVEANHCVTAMTQYTYDELMGASPRILRSGRHPTEFYQEMWHSLLTHGMWRGEVWNRKKNGEVYPESLSISAVYDAEGAIRHYVGIFSDITQQKLYEKQLEKMAYYDVLTQLPNRSLLVDRLEHAMLTVQESGQFLAVAYLDLDGFKAINDTLGHKAGDLLLIEVAQRIKKCLSTEDTAARLGGDEFVLLLLNLNNPTACQSVLEAILTSVAAPYEISGHEARISCSLGVTVYPNDHCNLDTLLRHADQAMYRAKLKKNTICYF